MMDVQGHPWGGLLQLVLQQGSGFVGDGEQNTACGKDLYPLGCVIGMETLWGTKQVVSSWCDSIVHTIGTPYPRAIVMNTLRGGGHVEFGKPTGCTVQPP